MKENSSERESATEVGLKDDFDSGTEDMETKRSEEGKKSIMFDPHLKVTFISEEEEISVLKADITAHSPYITSLLSKISSKKKVLKKPSSPKPPQQKQLNIDRVLGSPNSVTKMDNSINIPSDS
jgi:hypothetical protein